MAQGDQAPAQRRASGLPRSISDISETHSLQAYASLRDHGSATDVSLPFLSLLPRRSHPSKGAVSLPVELLYS
jgi:hypothetical protein